MLYEWKQKRGITLSFFQKAISVRTRLRTTCLRTEIVTCVHFLLH